MANEDHVKIVINGAEAIELWRKENHFSIIDLQGADLRRAKLENANLNNADLRNANLILADLRWADLIEADLSNADLTRADFHKCDLTNAKLVKANLKMTNFEDANLSNADLAKATFSNTRLLNTDLSNCKGLEICEHNGSSNIDHETIIISSGLPLDFLRKCGLSEREIKLTVKRLASAEVFNDFILMAEYLLKEGYKDAAAVIIGGIIEQKIKYLCEANGIETTILKNGKINQKNFSKMNQDLYGKKVYEIIDYKNMESCYTLRNKAAHGEYNKYNQENVENMMRIVLEFIARYKS